MISEEAITQWIEMVERKFGQFNDPQRFGAPPPNPGNGMWRADARKWASYTSEKKREVAIMNLGPYIPDALNATYCANVARDSMDFQHAAGRYKPDRVNRN